MKQNYPRYAIGVLTLSALMANCKKSSSHEVQSPLPTLSKTTAPASPLQGNSSHKEQKQLKSCLKPPIFETPKEGFLSLQDLKAQLPGNYELDEVHIYHVGEMPDGTQNGAFYGKATRFNKQVTKKELNDIKDLHVRNMIQNTTVRDTELSIPCQETPTDSKTPFISGATVSVPAVIHLPTGRVTIFDEYSELDHPQFNFPALADVHFDSLGMASYENQHGSGSPYLTKRYLHDWIDSLPSKPQIFSRREGFEFRFHYEEPRTLKPGSTFQAHTFVIISYRPNRDDGQKQKSETLGPSPLLITIKQEGKNLLWEAKNQSKKSIWIHRDIPVEVKSHVSFTYPVWFEQENRDLLIVKRTPPPWRGIGGPWLLLLKPNQVRTGKVHLGINQFTANLSGQPSTNYPLHQIAMEIAWFSNPLPKKIQQSTHKVDGETILIATEYPPIQIARSMILNWDSNLATQPRILPQGVSISEDQVLDPSPMAKNQIATLFSCQEYQKKHSYLSCKDLPTWLWEVTADYKTYQTSAGEQLQEVSITRLIDASTGKGFSELHQGWPTVSN